MIIECPHCKEHFEHKKQKSFALNLIQIAWVYEVIIITAFGFILIIFSRTEQFGMFFSILPQLTQLIMSQGVIAGGGPLVSRAIERKKEGQND